MGHGPLGPQTSEHLQSGKSPPRTKAEAVSGRKYGPCIVTLDFPLATLRKEKETGEINFNYIFI